MDKFKVGDRVRIVRRNAVMPCGHNDAMNKYIGEFARIRSIDEYHGQKYVQVNGNPWAWDMGAIELADAAIMDNPCVEIKLPKPKKPRKKALSTILHGQMGASTGLVSYALRFNDRDDYVHTNDVCNARMHWPGEVGKGKCTEIVMDVCKNSGRRLRPQQQPAFHKYIHYILNDSPWSKCFLTKKVGTALRYGVKFNLDMTNSQVVGAAIALRSGWEFQEKLELFHELSKKHPLNTAFLVGFLLTYAGGKYLQSGFNCGHHCLNTEMKWKEVKRFFIEGYKDRNKPIRTTRESYKVFKEISPSYGEGKYELPNMGDEFKKVAGAVLDKAAYDWNYKVAYTPDGVAKLIEWINKELTNDN